MLHDDVAQKVAYVGTKVPKNIFAEHCGKLSYRVSEEKRNIQTDRPTERRNCLLYIRFERGS